MWQTGRGRIYGKAAYCSGGKGILTGLYQICCAETLDKANALLERT